MIVLDTNVVSEFAKAAPDPRVSAWIRGYQPADLFTTSITVAEIFQGIRGLPQGRRRRDLAEAAHAMFNRRFDERILPFDQLAAGAYADIVTARRRAGRPISTFDAQIGAIVLVWGADLATRNVKDFDGCGIALIDPWNI